MLKEIKDSANGMQSFSNRVNKQIKNNPEFLNSVIEETKFLNEHYDYIPLNQRLHHIWNGINTVEVCPYCGGALSVYFRENGNFKRYNSTCGNKVCVQKDKSTTCIEKFGVENPFQNESIKEKIKLSNLNKYGVSHISQSDMFKEKYKKTCIEKFGVENSFQNESIKEKIKLSNLNKYGVEFPGQSKILRDKAKSTCLEKYGVLYSFQSQLVKEKIKSSILEKYGVEFVGQSKICKAKAKETLFNNYGIEHTMQSKILRDKAKSTCLKKYGVENPMQSKILRDKAKSTCLKKYGVENPMQSEEMFKKQQRFKRKPYTLPSGKIVNIQGYEHFYLDYYFSGGGLENNIQCEKIKVIPYTLNGKKHKYYPDFYLKNENKIIEVKSNWTFERDFGENLAKRSACIEQGYVFEFFIYDRKGNRLDDLVAINKI